MLGFRTGCKRSHGCGQLDPGSSYIQTDFPWEHKKYDMRCEDPPKTIQRISSFSILNSKIHSHLAFTRFKHLPAMSQVDAVSKC